MDLAFNWVTGLQACIQFPNANWPKCKTEQKIKNKQPNVKYCLMAYCWWFGNPTSHWAISCCKRFGPAGILPHEQVSGAMTDGWTRGTRPCFQAPMTSGLLPAIADKGTCWFSFWTASAVTDTATWRFSCWIAFAAYNISILLYSIPMDSHLKVQIKHSLEGSYCGSHTKQPWGQRRFPAHITSTFSIIYLFHIYLLWIQLGRSVAAVLVNWLD